MATSDSEALVLSEFSSDDMSAISIDSGYDEESGEAEDDGDISAMTLDSDGEETGEDEEVEDDEEVGDAEDIEDNEEVGDAEDIEDNEEVGDAEDIEDADETESKVQKLKDVSLNNGAFQKRLRLPRKGCLVLPKGHKSELGRFPRVVDQGKREEKTISPAHSGLGTEIKEKLVQDVGESDERWAFREEYTLRAGKVLAHDYLSADFIIAIGRAKTNSHWEKVSYDSSVCDYIDQIDDASTDQETDI